MPRTSVGAAIVFLSISGYLLLGRCCIPSDSVGVMTVASNGPEQLKRALGRVDPQDVNGLPSTS